MGDEGEPASTLHAALQLLSPPERVALCSPDISQFGQRLRPAEFSPAPPPPEPGALDREDALANRVLVQPVAILQSGPLGGGAADAVMSRLRRLRFSAEYFGLQAAPICLDLVAPATGSDSGCKGLVGAGGSASALEFCLHALRDVDRTDGDTAAGGPGAELLEHLRMWPLMVDVWDGDSVFALGSVALPGLGRLVRQGREAVYFYDVCSFLVPLALTESSEVKGSEAPLAASTDTKEVQLRGLDLGASVAFRVICMAQEPPAPEPLGVAGGSGGSLLISPAKFAQGQGATRVPLKRRNAAEDDAPHTDDIEWGTGKPGSRAYLDLMLKHAEGGGGGFAGWHRARPDQSALPQRAALALVYVNQHRVLEALRVSAQKESMGLVAAMAQGNGRGAQPAAAPRRRWSELPLTAEALTAPLVAASQD